MFVNNALRAWHADRYPASADRMLVVPNGWDPDLLEVAAGFGIGRFGASVLEPRRRAV